MIELIGQKWKAFVEMISNVLLIMDTDPLEDMHCKVRRLEAAISQLKVGRGFTEPDHE